MRRATPLVTTLLLLGAPAAALAANPVTLGTDGERAWVFVDRQGVTHVAWDVTSGLQSRTFYRRAPAGSSTFTPPVELPVGTGTDFAGIYITQDPAPSDRLVLMTERCCQANTPQTYALTSADNGATWSAATGVADPSPSLNPTNGRVNLVANGPQGIWTINGNPSARLLKIPSALTPPVTLAQQTDLSPNPYDGHVVFDTAGQPVFSFGRLTPSGYEAFVRVGESGPDQLALTSSIVGSVKLASGPRGILALTYGGNASTGRYALEARLLQGGALAAPVAVTAPNDSTMGVPYLAADQTGRFHAVWRSGGDLYYSRSETGTAWTPRTRLSRGVTVFDPVVSAGPDGGGWAVWVDRTSSARVLAVPLSVGTEDPAVPDTRGIPNPLVIRRGSSIFVTPRRPSLRDLRRTKCVRVRVQSTRPASVRVAIFSGRRSIRIFGATIVRFAAPGKRTVCIRVPLRARTFDVRQPFRFAFAVREGQPGGRQSRARLTTTNFLTFR